MRCAVALPKEHSGASPAKLRRAAPLHAQALWRPDAQGFTDPMFARKVHRRCAALHKQPNRRPRLLVSSCANWQNLWRKVLQNDTVRGDEPLALLWQHVSASPVSGEDCIDQSMSEASATRPSRQGVRHFFDLLHIELADCGKPNRSPPIKSSSAARGRLPRSCRPAARISSSINCAKGRAHYPSWQRRRCHGFNFWQRPVMAHSVHLNNNSTVAGRCVDNRFDRRDISPAGPYQNGPGGPRRAGP